ncbi:MAG: Carbamoyltransferase HypF [Actinobacteria bacterium ADurb.Bin346]|nr:MAG: Carbamoyltransferase HypF [Actinobacteria bacterium ADurb.Bin346]
MQLRKKKKRPSKPFAIMFRDSKMASAYYKLNKAQIQSLKSPGAPVLLVKKNPGTAARHISDRVSGFNNYEGIMIAYTPLHHLLFKNIDVPLVMTSGNVSEEPIASENNEAINKLGGICDYFLTNNRDIFSKYDDSVIRIIGNREASIRRARGYAPYPIKIECDAGKNPVLATGAQEKNTFCLLYSKFAIISQHLGDMDNAETVHFFKDTLENYMKIFGLPGLRMVVHDCHPGYATTDFAKSFMPSAQKLAVQHHKAHIASVIAENRLLNDMKNDFIGFAWDGTGYGDDGKIWGSEVFTVNRKLEFKRISHLAEKVLPGGEATIKNPYRMSLVYLYNFWKKVICSPADLKSADLKIDFNRYVYNEFPHYKEIIPLLEMQLVTRQIETGFNSPLTTSMGRLFDAVSSLLNLIHVSTYEGEAAVRLEMAASGTTGKQYTLCLVENNNELIIDDFHLFNQIVADIKNNIAVSIISSKFHNSLAHLILHTCRIHREKSGIDTVLLSGGVFQNHLLLTKTARILKKEGFKVYSNNKVPVNDGGISLGQAFIAAVAQDCKNKI